MKWNTRTKNAILNDCERYGLLLPNILDRGDKIETNYGLETITLTSEHIKALIDGKALSFDIGGGEYAGLIFLKIEPTKKPIKTKKESIKVKEIKEIIFNALEESKKG